MTGLLLAVCTNIATGEDQAGLVNRTLWQHVSREYKSFLDNSYADDIPWIFKDQKSESTLPHIGDLTPPRPATGVWLRFLLTPKISGYYILSVEAGGALQVLLSDDATPEKFKRLWYDGSSDQSRQPGFQKDSDITESSWIYLAAGQPRLVDIRYFHRLDPTFLNLLWTTPDGIRGKIPDDCVSPWKTEKIDAFPSYQDWTDREWREDLKNAGVEAKPLDLKTAKALTSGWSVYHDSEFGYIPPFPDPHADHGLVSYYGGSREIPFTTSHDGYAALTTRVALFAGPRSNARVICEREIDGIFFGRQQFATKSNQSNDFHVVTPWLKAGKHSLRLHFERMEQPATTILCDASIGTIFDKAVIEKIKSHLAEKNRFLPQRGDGGCLISPACVEIASRVSQAPELQASGRKIALQPATTGTWWADVPLPASGKPVTLDANFAADQMHATATAQWIDTQISEHSVIYLRVGDSLRLTAAPANARPDTDASITFHERIIPTPSGKPFVCRFDKPGTETIVGRFTDDQAQPVTHQLVVHVLPRMAESHDSPQLVSKGPAQFEDMTDRILSFKNLPEGAWPDGGEVLSFRALPIADGKGWQVYNKQAGALRGVVRAGPAGPILGTMPFTGVTTGNQIYRYIFHYEEKMSDYKNSVLIQVFATGLPKGWKIKTSVQQGAKPIYPDKNDPKGVTVWPWHAGNMMVGDCWMETENENSTTKYVYPLFVKPDSQK